MSGSRFDKLERSRKESAEPDERPSARGTALDDRFAPQQAVPQTQEAPEAQLPRFEADGTQGLRTDRHTDEEQPFIRCPVCERDWGRFDTRCGQCGEALDSDAARAFNAALWAKRLEERRVEAEGVAQRAAATAEQQRELTDARKGMAIALAQQVKHRYEVEAAVDEVRSSWGSPYDWRWRALGGFPFLVLAAIRTQGPARWLFVALAAFNAGVGAWLWLRDR